MKHFLLIIACLITATKQNNATQHRVPQQFSTIQAALNSCQANDTVVVSPGTYYENIVWPDQQGIRLTARGNPSKTIIDGMSTDRVMVFDFAGASQVDTTTHVTGFTLRNGKVIQQSDSKSGGAAIYLYNASPVFSNCIISSCRSIGSLNGNYSNLNTYGVISSHTSNPVFRYITIQNNSSDSSSAILGGIMYCISGMVRMENCSMINNVFQTDLFVGGGLFYCQADSLIFDKMKIVNNSISTNSSNGNINGGLFNGSNYSVTNSLIANNTIGGTFWSLFGGVFMGGGNHITILNCTVAFNNITNTEPYYHIHGKSVEANYKVVITNSILWNPGNDEESETDGRAWVSYSDVRSGQLINGNIKSDPQFVSQSDFHLQFTSPCIGTGTNAGAPSTDLDGNPRPAPSGTHTDIGCYEIKQQLRTSNEESQTDADLKLHLFPNPSRGTFSLEYYSSTSGAAIIQLKDVSGRKVLEKSEDVLEGINAFHFNYPSLKPGIYFLEVKEGSKVGFMNLVIEK